MEVNVEVTNDGNARDSEVDENVGGHKENEEGDCGR
jgi:hypothetical protein